MNFLQQKFASSKLITKISGVEINLLTLEVNDKILT